MLLANSGCHECGKTGRFGLREGNAVPPIDQAFEINRNGGSDMLEMSFQESPIAGLSHTEGHGLRNGPLNASPESLACFEGIRLLIGPDGGKDLVLGLGPKGQLAALAFGVGAEGTDGTRATIGRAKLHVKARLALFVVVRAPRATDLALWTGNTLSLPIDLEVT